MEGISFSVGTPPDLDGPALAATARRAERLGYRALRVADHPGVVPSPFVTLGHVAATTSTLRLETYVVNAGLRDPLPLACDVATLDALSGGRVTLGIGAGHTPAEWEAQGLVRPAAGHRIDRLIEVATATRRLLAGEPVTTTGSHVTLNGAQIVAPRPVQDPVPLLIGGANHRLIEFALGRADVVALSGLGRTLADGHMHETRWSRADLDSLAARLAPRRPGVVVDALVQFVKITDDREADADRFAARWTTSSGADVLACPFVLLGTLDQLASEVAEHRDRFGITSYCVRAAAMDVLAPLVTG